MLMLFYFDSISTEGRTHKLPNSEDIVTLALLVPEIYHSEYFTFYAL